MIKSDSHEVVSGRIIKNQDQQTQPKSRNMKNIYIQKLSKIMHISRENLLEAQENGQNDEIQGQGKRTNKKTTNGSCSGFEAPNTQDKLQKNRQSARKARKRKKLYVKLLQREVQRLKQIAIQGKKIEQDTTIFMNKLRNHISEKKDLFNLKPVIIKNMYNVSNCSNVAQQNINSLINSYQTKIGPATKQRFQMLDKYTHQIQQSYLPNHIQKLLNSTVQTNSSENIVRSDISNQKHISKTIIQKLRIEQSKLSDLFLNLRNHVQQAKQQLRWLNHLIDEMREEFSGMQVCKFLVFIENEKNKEDVISEFVRHLKELKYNKIKQNEQELYSFIFKEDLKKTIFINVAQSQDLMRRMMVYLNRDID